MGNTYPALLRTYVFDSKAHPENDLASQDVSQAVFQIGRPKLVLRRIQNSIIDFCARKQQRLSHFPKGQLCHEARDRKDRRAAQDSTESLGEFVIGHRIWCHTIHGPLDRICHQRVIDSSRDII